MQDLHPDWRKQYDVYGSGGELQEHQRREDRAHAAASGSHDRHGRCQQHSSANDCQHRMHYSQALERVGRLRELTSPDVLIAAVLHDVVEDTHCTLAEITAAFGSQVALLVCWVTIPPAGSGQDRGAVKEPYLRRLAGA